MAPIARVPRASWIAVIIGLAIVGIGLGLRVLALGQDREFFVVQGGSMYWWHARPADNLIQGNGLIQAYPTYPGSLPVLMYQPGLPLLIALLKTVRPTLSYDAGMIQALAFFAFAMLSALLTTAYWMALPPGPARLRLLWSARPFDGALPPLTVWLLAVAAFPASIQYDLVPLGGAQAGAFFTPGVVFLCWAHHSKSLLATGMAGGLLALATYFRMEPYPVALLLVGTFVLANLQHARGRYLILTLVLAFLLMLAPRRLYNAQVFGSFSDVPGPSLALRETVATCVANRTADDGINATRSWAGNFGGFYFPDPVMVDRTLFQALQQEVTLDVGIWKALECSVNRLPGWIEGIEYEMSQAIFSITGLSWRPWQYLFTAISTLGLLRIAIKSFACVYLLAAALGTYAVQMFLGAWVAFYHECHILPILLLGLIGSSLFLVEDVPAFFFRREVPRSVVLGVILVPWLGITGLSALAGIGRPVNLDPQPRYVLRVTETRPLTGQDAPTGAPALTFSRTRSIEGINAVASPVTVLQGSVGPVTAGAIDQDGRFATTWTAHPGEILGVTMDVTASGPSKIKVELDRVDLPGVAQYSLAVESGPAGTVMTPAPSSWFRISARTQLPGWMAPGPYQVRIASEGKRSEPVGFLQIEPAPAQLVDLTANAKILVVPPPTVNEGKQQRVPWLVGQALPDPGISTLGVLGSVGVAAGWVKNETVLVYLDFGESVSRIDTIVAHGAYGPDGPGGLTRPPLSASFAVSDNGLKWRTTPAPIVPAGAFDWPTQQSAMHIGVEGLGLSGRYVRIALHPAAEYGFNWGIMRFYPGKVFVSRVQVLGAR